MELNVIYVIYTVQKKKKIEQIEKVHLLCEQNINIKTNPRYLKKGKWKLPACFE